MESPHRRDPAELIETAWNESPGCPGRVVVAGPGLADLGYLLDVVHGKHRYERTRVEKFYSVRGLINSLNSRAFKGNRRLFK